MLPECFNCLLRYVSERSEYTCSYKYFSIPKKCVEFVWIAMVTVREVEEKDITPLAEFLSKNLPSDQKDFWLHRFEMWWVSNPASTPDIPRGWILENETMLVGFMGNIPVKFLIHGKVKIAAAASDWCVDSSVRGIFSISLLTEYLKQKNVSLFLFDTEYEQLMEQLMAILIKCKFNKYFFPQSETEYFYIINRKKVGFVFINFILYRRIPKLTELFELGKKLCILTFAYLFQKPANRVDDLIMKEYTTSLCTFCDDSFSKIWEPYLKTCDVTLSRDTKTLNWLYFSPNGRYNRVVIQCRKSSDNSLAGYMVFDIIRKQTSETRIMQLMDMCIENNDPKILASLISFAIEIGGLNNAALLVLWANSHETETYFRNTFIMRRVAQNNRVFRFSDTYEMNSGEDYCFKMCSSLIDPPGGTN